MNPTIEIKLKEAKESYAHEGFNILGVFGSFARNEETPQSDIDILYELSDSFVNRYDGFMAFERLSNIKSELKALFGKEVDIATKSGLSRTGKKYILKDLYHV